MKKKTCLVIILVVIIILGSGCMNSTPSQSEKDKENIPTITAIPTTVPIIQKTSLTVAINCQKSSNDIYGGINGNENIPPKGTEIRQDLTKYYGRTTTTGECGIYWYIAGWWFNDTEMMKLPYESLMYGMSPYAISPGSSMEGMAPIPPVPELNTAILVSVGIFGIFVISRRYRSI